MVITEKQTTSRLRYHGHVVTVSRWSDMLSGKPLRYQAIIDGNDQWTVDSETCIELAGKINRLLGEIQRE